MPKEKTGTRLGQARPNGGASKRLEAVRVACAANIRGRVTLSWQRVWGRAGVRVVRPFLAST